MQSYAIANCDSEPDEGYFLRVRELVEAGIEWIQLRAKSLEDARVYAIGQKLRDLTRGGSTRLMVNSRADIAAAISADGVHLPARGLPITAARMLGGGLIVGRSCHSVEDCREAADQGADYVLLGPVFSPRSKPGAGRITREDLAAAAGLGAPVFALGGLTRENMQTLRDLNIAGIAAITLFMSDRSPAEIVRMVRALR